MYNQEDLNPVLAHNLRDEALMKLINIANRGAKISATLIIEGVVVYGDVISGKVYFDESIKKINSDTSGGQVIADVTAAYTGLSDALYSDLESLHTQPFFLHLENYSFLKGDGGILKHPGEFLRVSVQKVSAFSLGRPSQTF